MADEIVPTLMTHVHVLTPILGMHLNFLKDVVIFGLWASAVLGSSCHWLASVSSCSRLLSGLDTTTGAFPRATASGRPPSCVLKVAPDCSGAPCPSSGTYLSFRATCLMLGASGNTCSDALGSVAASTIIGSFGSALGTACSLVDLALADDGFPSTASSSRTSVDAAL
jgi:hypothetical protein